MIPATTGISQNLCGRNGSRLHLIKPLGFRLDEKEIRRAGLDYWKDLDVTVYDNYRDFIDKNPGARIYMATTKARHSYTHVEYEPDCYIMFGKESAGIPEELLLATEYTIRIPMIGDIRSLNLANPWQLYYTRHSGRIILKVFVWRASFIDTAGMNRI